MVIAINRSLNEAGAVADACENPARRLQELSVSETEKDCGMLGNGGRDRQSSTQEDRYEGGAESQRTQVAREKKEENEEEGRGTKNPEQSMEEIEEGMRTIEIRSNPEQSAKTAKRNASTRKEQERRKRMKKREEENRRKE